MNIKDAKEQIKNAMTVYFTKDEFNNYILPIEKQRPVFLIGPPGIGKTAIMEQIAQELNVAIVSYSMTHHTRQSALGLPFITKKIYDGVEYDISEYTMSEIIASVYDTMEETGKKEGILFLDEINCVSETLSPIMLQFLQYKFFGRHRVPQGWIVVTAGNPPEYNNSVHEFDIVTWDRLKRIDVEPDFNCWKEYAYNAGVHPSVLTYLEIKKDNFYKVESSVEGKNFVTARGWEDLSRMISLYEINNITVDIKLIEQYLQNPKIAKDFSAYYDLFNKYRSDYQIDSILSGKVEDSIKTRAENAKFDERITLLGLILDAVSSEICEVIESEQLLKDYTAVIRDFRFATAKRVAVPVDELNKLISAKENVFIKGKKLLTLSTKDQNKLLRLISSLNDLKALIIDCDNGAKAFEFANDAFNKMTTDLKKNDDSVGKHLDNVFRFLEEVFGDGQEMLIFVTELTVSFYGSQFIRRFGCKEYFRHNKKLLFYDRQQEILNELENISSEYVSFGEFEDK